MIFKRFFVVFKGKILGRIKNQRQMLIQWRDGQQTFQNVYYIFTSRNHQNMRREEFVGFEVDRTARSYGNMGDDDEFLEEYEEDKYVTRKRFGSYFRFTFFLFFLILPKININIC